MEKPSTGEKVPAEGVRPEGERDFPPENQQRVSRSSWPIPSLHARAKCR